jgi:hypothetical protein
VKIRRPKRRTVQAKTPKAATSSKAKMICFMARVSNRNAAGGVARIGGMLMRASGSL